MRKSIYICLSIGLVVFLPLISINLASMLGISTYAAKKIIDIIDAGSTILLISGIISTILGAGLVQCGIVAVAKAIMRKYGKKYAVMW